MSVPRQMLCVALDTGSEKEHAEQQLIPRLSADKRPSGQAQHTVEEQGLAPSGHAMSAQCRACLAMAWGRHSVLTLLPLQQPFAQAC